MKASVARYPDILESWQDRSKLTRAMANAISTGNWNIKRFRIDRAGVSQVGPKVIRVLWCWSRRLRLDLFLDSFNLGEIDELCEVVSRTSLLCSATISKPSLKNSEMSAM